MASADRAILALESVTQGVAIATSHRVLSPEKGSTPRYSIPFFQMVSQGTVIGRQGLECQSVDQPIEPYFTKIACAVPAEIRKIKESRGNISADCTFIYAVVELTFPY